MSVSKLKEVAAKIGTTLDDLSPEKLAAVDNYRQQFEKAFTAAFPDPDALHRYLDTDAFANQELGVVLSPIFSDHFTQMSYAVIQAIVMRKLSGEPTNAKSTVLTLLQAFAAAFVLGSITAREAVAGQGLDGPIGESVEQARAAS